MAAPEWLHLLPNGRITAKDGRGPFRLENAAQVAASSLAQAGGKLVLDENHATDLAAPKGGAAPARGWIVDLQARSDGIWGRVLWSEAAKRSKAWMEYRGVSPVIVHRKDGMIEAILRASLVNQPNLVGLTSLHNVFASDAMDEQALEDRVQPGQQMDEIDQAIAVHLGIDPKVYERALASTAFRAKLIPMRRQFIKEGVHLVDEADLPLGAADQTIIAKMGLDPASYRATLAKEGLRTSLHGVRGLNEDAREIVSIIGAFAASP